MPRKAAEASAELANLLDRTRAEIEQKLVELDAERKQLETVLAAIVGGAAETGRSTVSRVKRGPGRPPGSKNKRRGPGRPPGSKNKSKAAPSSSSGAKKRGRKPQRANEAVKLIKASPGITIAELAKQMKIAPNYLYRVLPRLQEEGTLERDGKGWTAK